ncbi:MAG: lipase family protein, partial [Gemmataceae bacterium]
SLGGALALLGAWLFLRKTINVHQVYTFGAPMIGNQDTVAAFNREFGNKITRCVNRPDPVPLLPMMSMIANDYHHVETAMVLGAAGGSNDAIEFVQQMASTAVDGVLSGSLIDEFWNVVKGRINAHFLNDYRQQMV